MPCPQGQRKKTAGEGAILLQLCFPWILDTSWALSLGTRELVGVCCLRLLLLPWEGVPHRLPPRMAQEEPPHLHSRPQGPSYH